MSAVDEKHGDALEHMHDSSKEALVHPKKYISDAVRKAMKEKQLSLRKTADLIPGMSFPQIARITGGENYNIHTLLKVLDVLGLEIEIKKKA